MGPWQSVPANREGGGAESRNRENRAERRRAIGSSVRSRGRPMDRKAKRAVVASSRVSRNALACRVKEVRPGR
jgi:hypothetical protein